MSDASLTNFSDHFPGNIPLPPPPELPPVPVKHEDRIQFVDNHRVSLESGDYELSVRQVLSGLGSPDVAINKKQLFSISGERFSLGAGEIQACFPPDSSRGHYWHALPHIILNRSTLPWERSALSDSSDAATDPPWLALLLFDQDNDDEPLPSVENDYAGYFKKSDAYRALFNTGSSTA